MEWIARLIHSSILRVLFFSFLFDRPDAVRAYVTLGRVRIINRPAGRPVTVAFVGSCLIGGLKRAACSLRSDRNQTTLAR
jgi:hypothetical protein